MTNFANSANAKNRPDPKPRRRQAARPSDRRRSPANRIAAAATLCLCLTGCISGSLATSTGPNGPQAWSAASQQDAHVGEEVRFSFILVNPMLDRPMDPYGYVDYCVTSVGETDRFVRMRIPAGVFDSPIAWTA